MKCVIKLVLKWTEHLYLVISKHYRSAIEYFSIDAYYKIACDMIPSYTYIQTDLNTRIRKRYLRHSHCIWYGWNQCKSRIFEQEICRDLQWPRSVNTLGMSPPSPNTINVSLHHFWQLPDIDHFEYIHFVLQVRNKPYRLSLMEWSPHVQVGL